MTAPSVVPGRERELDALIAEKVFGWLWLYRFGHRWFGPPETVGETHPLYGMVWAWDAATFPDAEREDAWWLRDVAPDADSPVVPHYSTDIAAAWQVVEKMAERGFWCVVKSPFAPGKPYHAGFTPHDWTGWNGRADHRGSGDSPALAICIAALEAVEASRRAPVPAVDPSWSSPDAAAVAPPSVPSRDAGGAER